MELAAAGPTGYTLTADPGSYTVTGAAAILRVARKLLATPGAYAVTGPSATLTVTAAAGRLGRRRELRQLHASARISTGSPAARAGRRVVGLRHRAGRSRRRRRAGKAGTLDGASRRARRRGAFRPRAHDARQQRASSIAAARRPRRPGLGNAQLYDLRRTGQSITASCSTSAGAIIAGTTRRARDRRQLGAQHVGGWPSRSTSRTSQFRVAVDGGAWSAWFTPAGTWTKRARASVLPQASGRHASKSTTSARRARPSATRSPPRRGATATTGSPATAAGGPEAHGHAGHLCGHGGAGRAARHAAPDRGPGHVCLDGRVREPPGGPHARHSARELRGHGVPGHPPGRPPRHGDAGRLCADRQRRHAHGRRPDGLHPHRRPRHVHGAPGPRRCSGWRGGSRSRRVSTRVTGSAASLRAARRVLATPGAYALTGSAAALLLSRRLGATPGSYLVTGSDASLTVTGVAVGFLLSATPGAYSSVGSPASLSTARRLAAAAGQRTRSRGVWRPSRAGASSWPRRGSIPARGARPGSAPRGA